MSNGQPVRVKSPLGDDLLFSSLDLSEELGRMFRCELELLSPREDVELDDVLGEGMTLEIDLPNGDTRYFHGWVGEMAQTGRFGDYATYTAVLHPWLWFLTRTADCKIFQGTTVPDIITSVLDDNGFTDVKDLLTGEYRVWEYCVQYRETDFSFLSRLMEQEGIYYFFEHEDGKDWLVLADAPSCHSPIPGYERVPYFPPSDNVVREEHVYDWRLSRSVRPGSYGLSAFDFRKPRADLEVYKSIKRAHSRSGYEVFDYPGEYYVKGEGEAYVGARIEELQTQYERVQGETDAMGLYPGGLFELEGYPRDDQNREYLIVATHHSLSLGDYASGTRGEGMNYSCAFEALESQSPFRAERITPKPFVQGPQTAIVSGPSGEEIHTDDYGRVKVQFRWDRYGKSDESSSCWIRVAQVWAGTKWGGMMIPRIGQEVIVDFIEGDPDRPIITGRVYNNDNMPPYVLPDNKTQSGIKSRSSKGGGGDNFNEIRFEDKSGEEEMYIHAEKDQTIMVENDKSETVGHDNTESVGNDENIEVGNDRNKTVGNNQTESIGVDKTIDVGSNHTESIGSNKQLSVGSNHTESIASNMTINVGSNLTETVAINYAETVGAAMELTVGAAMTETVGADKTQTIGKNKSESIGDSLAMQIGKDQSVDVGKTLTINAGDQITIKTGKATIMMKKDGTISIQGKDITVKGSGAVNMKANKDIVMKGKKILEN